MSFFDQYQAAKKAHAGMILLFRMGDFYEVFGEDARTVAKVLGLTLTSREWSKGETNKQDMAGFPYHQLQSCLQRLLKAGHRVAIAEAVADAPRGRGENHGHVRGSDGE